uniref:J domain-containing protein n=1 Tax=viral metagenome TaxID=1070528 RepID=A0A6C0KI50_9ZZZZ
MDVDLNIENYNLDDLLNLFHLEYKYTYSDLKKAFKIVSQLHPDKSHLDSKYFIFFKKAYSLLLNIYKFKIKPTERNTNFNDKEKIKLLEKIKDKKNFNDWFNKMYEEHVNVFDEDKDTGYNDWFRNEKDDNNDVKLNSASQFEDFFHQKKKNSQLVKQNDIQDINEASGLYSLSRDRPIEYSSDVFSKLSYEDLKKAHTETVVPVTIDDYNNRQKFNTVQELNIHRNKQNLKPLNKKEANDYLSQREQEENKNDIRKIYKIIKQDEEYNKCNNTWWSKLKQLT